MAINAQAVAKVVCWSVRHPMQFGHSATAADAEDFVQQMGLELTDEIRSAIATYFAKWLSIGARR